MLKRAGLDVCQWFVCVKIYIEFEPICECLQVRESKRNQLSSEKMCLVFTPASGANFSSWRLAPTKGHSGALPGICDIYLAAASLQKKPSVTAKGEDISQAK